MGEGWRGFPGLSVFQVSTFESSLGLREMVPCRFLERGSCRRSEGGEIIDRLVGDGVESGLGGAVRVETPGDGSTWTLF